MSERKYTQNWQQQQNCRIVRLSVLWYFIGIIWLYHSKSHSSLQFLHSFENEWADQTIQLTVPNTHTRIKSMTPLTFLYQIIWIVLSMIVTQLYALSAVFCFYLFISMYLFLCGCYFFVVVYLFLFEFLQIQKSHTCDSNELICSGDDCSHLDELWYRIFYRFHHTLNNSVFTVHSQHNVLVSIVTYSSVCVFVMCPPDLAQYQSK